MNCIEFSPKTFDTGNLDKLGYSRYISASSWGKDKVHIDLNRFFRWNMHIRKIEMEKLNISFLAWMDRQIVAVMRMKSCDGRKASNEHAQTDDAQNLDWRKSYWHNEWARHDPLDQHWHLGPVGVLPSHQEKGIGTKLLRRFCKEVDTCLSPAYLETDTDRNVQFYERFGFEVAQETKIFDVKNRYMWRSAVS